MILDLTTSPLSVRLDEDTKRCALLLKARTEIMHQLFLGEIAFGRSVNEKLLLVRGSAAKLAKFWPLLKLCPTLYGDYVEVRSTLDNKPEGEMSTIRTIADKLGSSLSLDQKPIAGRAILKATNRIGFALGFAIGFAKEHVIRDLKLEDLMTHMSRGLAAGKRKEP